MNAPMTDAARSELADLRRRAYGPDSAGALDAAETARLHELEALQRPTRPTLQHTDRTAMDGRPAAVASDAPVVTDPGAPATSGVGAETPVDVAPTLAPAGEDAEAETPRAPWWRRRMVWVAALAGVVGLAAGIGIPALLAPRPTAVLGVVKGGAGFDSSDTAEGSIVAYLNLKTKTLQKLEKYGDIQGWIGETNDGSTCLLLAPADPSTGLYFYGASCTPAGMDWVVDVRITQDTQDLHLPEPAPRVGSVLRFQGHGDRVDLWIDEAPPART